MWNVEAMPTYLSLTSFPLLRHVVVITLMTGTTSEKPIHASGHVGDYEDRVPSWMYMSILFGGKCSRSANGSTDTREGLMTDIGPVVPHRFVEDVDALFYVPFASLARDLQRLRPASLLVARLEPLDTMKQRPPRAITRHIAMSPLDK